MIDPNLLSIHTQKHSLPRATFEFTMTQTPSPEDALAALGLALPQLPAPGGNYLSAKRVGPILYLAGVVSTSPEGPITGTAGLNRSVDEAYASARACALTQLAVLKRELGSLDLLSGGRLVVLPTVSWLAEEYEALGVPFRSRGDLLDEHLRAWATLWRDTPAAHSGRHYSFRDVYFEPKAFRPEGPPLWIGGTGMHRRMTQRIVTYGAGFSPLGRLRSEEMARLEAAMQAAGRDPRTLELVGGPRATFPDRDSVADLGQALATIPPQIAAGFSTFCIKPSQFTDDPAGVGRLCSDIMRRAGSLLP